MLLLLNSCGLYNYYRITKAKDSSYTIGPLTNQEFAFDIINNRIVIPVLIQGRSYNFLFDTGASLVIDSELLNELEYENIARIKAIDSNQKGESLKYIKLSEIKCFETSFKDQGAIVMDLSKPIRNSCINISGIFGASVMKDLIWQINFERQTIRVSNSIENLEVDSNHIKLPFEENPSHSPIIEVYINGNKENLIIDTGSGTSFSFPKLSIDFNSTDEVLTAFGKFSGVYGDSSDTVHYLSKAIELNPSTRGNWQGVIEVRNSLKDGLIGFGFLKDYLVTIDWINQYVYFKRINHSKPSWATYGFNIVKSGQNIIVSKVYKNLLAYEMGIRVGDIINEIDDFCFKNASENSVCKFIEKDYLRTNESTLQIKLNKVENYINLEKKYFFENEN